MPFDVIERPGFRVHILEIRKSFQMFSQMSLREKSLEARPTRGLRVFASLQCVERVDARVFPFEVRPAGATALGGFDNLQRLVGSAGGYEPTGDFCCNLWDLSRSCVILRDEGVDVALRVGDVCSKPNG